MKRSSSYTEPCSFERNSTDKKVVCFERSIPLPDELLTEIIFKMVPLCQWSKCLELVSKQFRHCVWIAYSQMKSINIRKLYSVHRSIKNLEKTWISLFREDTLPSARLNNILKKLLSVCPNLMSLGGMHCVARKIDADSWNILKNFQRLQSISLAGVRDPVEYGHFADFVVNCKNLKVLNCYFHSDFSGALEVDTFTDFERKMLDPNNCIFLENYTEKLTTLTFGIFEDIFKISGGAAVAKQAMKMCINLESLSVWVSTMYYYEILLNTLPNLRKLTHLGIYTCGFSLVDTAFDQEFCVQLDFLKNQLLSVEFGGRLSEEVQNFFLMKCPNLQSLKLLGPNALSANALKKLRNLPGELKTFGYSDIFNKRSDINEQILPLLLPHLMKLSNFTDLSIGERYASEEWENIAYLNNLQHLNVEGRINDYLLDKWDKNNDKMFEKLLSLQIQGYNEISDTGGCLLAKKSKNLEVLELSGTNISEKTISVLADVSKKLTTADFSWCHQLFDEKVILCFIKKATRLKKLILPTRLAKKVIQHKDFLPFVEIVEIPLHIVL